MNENIEKWGHFGVSKNIANGHFKLATWFHIKHFSIKAYAQHSYLTTIGGVAIWVFSFFSWPISMGYQYELFWIMNLSIILLLFSSMTFYQAFLYQNYNILGWMLFPIFFSALYHTQFGLLTLITAIMACVSLTSVIFASVFVLFSFFKTQNIICLLSFIPAGVICILPLFSLFKQGILLGTLKIYSSNLGAVKLTKNSYNRTPIKWYETILRISYYLLFAVCYLFFTDEYPFFTLIAIFLFIINQHISRIADIQSILIVVTSAMVTDFLIAPNQYMLAPLIISLNPMIGITHNNIKGERVYGWSTPMKPFDLGPIKRKVEEFLIPVQKGQRVFIAFDDPKGDYDKIFDGYRNLIEIFSVVATQKDFHIFPDWHLIFMHGEQRQFWGRKPKEVSQIMNNWEADYVIIYETGQYDVHPQWDNSGFQICNELNWKLLESEMAGDYPYSNNHPKMYLLKRR